MAACFLCAGCIRVSFHNKPAVFDCFHHLKSHSFVQRNRPLVSDENIEHHRFLHRRTAFPNHRGTDALISKLLENVQVIQLELPLFILEKMIVSGFLPVGIDRCILLNSAGYFLLNPTQHLLQVDIFQGFIIEDQLFVKPKDSLRVLVLCLSECQLHLFFPFLLQQRLNDTVQALYHF